MHFPKAYSNLNFLECNLRWQNLCRFWVYPFALGVPLLMGLFLNPACFGLFVGSILILVFCELDWQETRAQANAYDNDVFHKEWLNSRRFKDFQDRYPDLSEEEIRSIFDASGL